MQPHCLMFIVKYLPLHSYSRTLDAGIIAAFKTHYQKLFSSTAVSMISLKDASDGKRWQLYNSKLLAAHGNGEIQAIGEELLTEVQ